MINQWPNPEGQDGSPLNMLYLQDTQLSSFVGGKEGRGGLLAGHNSDHLFVKAFVPERD